MVLRNDGQEELSPPIWCTSREMQSARDCVNTPEGTPGGFGPNPLQKNIIQEDQTDNLKTFLKGEPQILGVAQILIGLMKVCLFATNQCFYYSDFSYWCHPLSMVSGYPIWGSFFIKGSLGMNTLSAVVGGIGTIISTVELTVELKSERRCLIFRAFETVILVLSLLEISIAISLSVFGCKVTCFVSQVVVIQSTNDKLPSVTAPYEHVYEELEF
ncbi:membrane-spanning 4-domains subfamily A member 4A-like isoform X2 [Canis lupus familiaris]|uniref:Membrane spanning 4-domains A4A n=2 Tax=Canis lupus familiaris TaxID=9615 RepID=A0A8P0P359_CANLF|nr:membrane-spanning 4-domains subfamily A member 4A-like isoform X2 [Canis lupus familiaris]XP_038312340.1 membrane-spanning 4-domains subfamily A member 4A-like isoform X2 [Canis lupus familiaris]XP_038424126.1 membrane-spanning 4-domains subfamily A member 4A-like isoform X2 [Canis lupus familiaris]